jgi:hypothetical protein
VGGDPFQHAANSGMVTPATKVAGEALFELFRDILKFNHFPSFQQTLLRKV